MSAVVKTLFFCPKNVRFFIPKWGQQLNEPYIVTAKVDPANLFSL